VRRLLLVLVLVAVGAACAGGEQRVRGIVVEVRADLRTVEQFTVVTEEGERMTFVPGPQLTRFDHGAPLSHLSEHLQTADPIRVTYLDEDGVLEAVLVEDVD
jgi:hypothetical protein